MQVLTARIAHLVAGGVDPASILAITFTRKAKAEMESRLVAMIGADATAACCIATFHSVGLSMLRR